MIILSIVVLCMLAMWAMYSFDGRLAAAPTQRASLAPRKAVPARRPAPPMTPSAAPAAIPLQWTEAAPTPRINAQVAPADPARAAETLRAKLRDRYLAARFPGVARVAADLEKIEHVIKAARLYFEEDKYDRALELLDMAIVQSPEDESLPLARLELAFLCRATPRFLTLAAAFHRDRPLDPHWEQISRLGKALVPSDPLFTATGDDRARSYGPWPDMPNWIQASWDLTSDVRAADFHHAMAKA